MGNPESYEKFSAWGRNIFSFGFWKLLDSEYNLEPDVSHRGAIPRGLGRSYGDSALNSNGNLISSEMLQHIEQIADTSVFICGAGVSIGSLSTYALERNYYPYVVPGTAHVTIGGAIAADIHGKSHHSSGSFSEYVRRIRILDSQGGFIDLFPNGPTERYFNATCGGLGLTGMIIEAEIQLMKVANSLVDVTEIRVASLSQMLKILKESDNEYQYSVAWIDLSGNYLGRGKVSLANHTANTANSRMKNARRQKRNPQLIVPFIGRFNVIRPFTVRIFNLFWYLKPLSNGSLEVQKYMHPLDPIKNWNKLYGPRGFIQYQFVIPFAHEHLLFEVLAHLKANKIASPLGVLKRLGKTSSALIGFAMPGWTLAIDIPASTPNLSLLFVKLDELVSHAGGRIYLVKDSRAHKELLISMYPNFNEFLSVKTEMDPDEYWQSDMYRRLMK